MSLQASTNVASTVANYFADNYQALLASSAAQLTPAITQVAPDTWKNLPENAGKSFYLKPANGSYTLAKVGPGEPPPENAINIDTNTAYGIETAQLSLVDWMMARIANDFRVQATAQNFGSVLTSNPEADLQFDLSSLDTASLVRLLNMLTGRNRDTIAEVAKGNALDVKASVARLGLASANLSNAIELQSRFALQASQEDQSGTFDALTMAVLDKFQAISNSDLEAARLAYRSSAVSSLGSDRLARVTQIAARALDSQLQGAADIAYLQNPTIAKFLSELDVQQNSQDGFVIKTNVAQGREGLVAALRADLVKILTDPALETELADALASQAEELGVADLSLPEQTAAFREIAREVLKAAATLDNYLQGVAAHSVAFHAEIAALVRNEVVAATERDAVTQNV